MSLEVTLSLELHAVAKHVPTVTLPVLASTLVYPTSVSADVLPPFVTAFSDV